MNRHDQRLDGHLSGPVTEEHFIGVPPGERYVLMNFFNACQSQRPVPNGLTMAALSIVQRLTDAVAS